MEEISFLEASIFRLEKHRGVSKVASKRIPEVVGNILGLHATIPTTPYLS